MNTKKTYAAFVLATLIGVAASCGGGSDSGAAPETTVATSAEPTEATEVVVAETTAIETSEADTTEPVSESSWSGPEFLPLAEARMVELSVPIGQPYSVEAVASVFEMPPAFPVVPDSVVTGIISSWEVDTLDGEIEELRIVGTDSVLTKEELTSFASSIGDNAAVSWDSASVSDGGSTLTALFVSEGDFEPGSRLVLKSFLEPKDGGSVSGWELDVTPSEIVAPAWAAGLPVPEGGELIGYREGQGAADDFGAVGGNGITELTMRYSPDSLAGLEAFFGTDVLERAGFTYEDTPFDNQSVRIDLSVEGWSGTVSVWEATRGGELDYYGLTWRLGRT